MEKRANPAIAKAMRALEGGIPRARADARLPAYHFRPPARWMGDINGPIYHNGRYHIFYQHNPYDEKFGSVHWGHARSKDLVFWEHLPIALWPSKDEGEDHCYSGASVINGEGRPMIFYTSMPTFEQWAAVGDDDLIVWEKCPGNPVLPASVHSDIVRIGAWRDPFIFKHDGHTYLICGGWTGEKRGPGHSRGIVSLYRGRNAGLTEWEYVGPLYCHPHSPDNACPNFFQVGEKWALFMSRHDPHVVNYYVGAWDLETFRFHPESAGTMGYSEDMYATQGLYDAKGRLILWGTLHAYRTGKGWIDWPGCLTLPRVVSLRPDGLLGFEPAPELRKLRGRRRREPGISLSSSSHVMENTRGDLLEIAAEFEPKGARAFGMKVRRSDDGKRAIAIRYDEDGLEVNGIRGIFNEKEKDVGPFKLLAGETTLQLRVFLDKAVMEVYANGRACFSRLLDSREEDLGVEVFAEEGAVRVKRFDAWEMGAIW